MLIFATFRQSVVGPIDRIVYIGILRHQ